MATSISSSAGIPSSLLQLLPMTVFINYIRVCHISCNLILPFPLSCSLPFSLVLQERWLDAKDAWDAFEKREWRREGEKVRDEVARAKAMENEGGKSDPERGGGAK